MPSLDESVARVAQYYAAQAPYYHEGSYGTQHTTIDYARLKSVYQTAFAGQSVLEIAAGTGYWTEVLARTAHTVLATDVNPGLVDLARQRVRLFPNVRFLVADAYVLDTIAERLSGAFAHYWWTHIPKKKRKSFLNTLHSKLRPGSLVVFADNLSYQADWVKRRVDEHGDTYEERCLPDGSRFETIKNFPTELEIVDLLRDIADEVEYKEYEPESIWTVSYRVRP